MLSRRIYFDRQNPFVQNPDFRPDGLKLYPTLVIRGTGLYELWRTGRYKVRDSFLQITLSIRDVKVFSSFRLVLNELL